MHCRLELLLLVLRTLSCFNPTAKRFSLNQLKANFVYRVWYVLLRLLAETYRCLFWVLLLGASYRWVPCSQLWKMFTQDFPTNKWRCSADVAAYSMGFGIFLRKIVFFQNLKLAIGGFPHDLDKLFEFLKQHNSSVRSASSIHFKLIALAKLQLWSWKFEVKKLGMVSFLSFLKPEDIICSKRCNTVMKSVVGYANTDCTVYRLKALRRTVERVPLASATELSTAFEIAPERPERFPFRTSASNSLTFFSNRSSHIKSGERRESKETTLKFKFWWMETFRYFRSDWPMLFFLLPSFGPFLPLQSLNF